MREGVTARIARARWLAVALLLRLLTFAAVSPTLAGQDPGQSLRVAPNRTLVLPRQPGATAPNQQSDSNQGESTKILPRVWFEACWSASNVIPYQWHHVSGPSRFEWLPSSERFCIRHHAKYWDSSFDIADLWKYENDAFNFRQSSAAEISGDTIRVQVSYSYTQVIPFRSGPIDRCEIHVTEHDEIQCVRQGEALSCEGHTVSWCSANPRADCNGDVWVDSNWRAIMRRE